MDLPCVDSVLLARDRLCEDVASELEARRFGESAQRPNHGVGKGLPTNGLRDGRVPSLAI
jgi:hypothetical protein